MKVTTVIFLLLFVFSVPTPGLGGRRIEERLHPIPHTLHPVVTTPPPLLALEEAISIALKENRQIGIDSLEVKKTGEAIAQGKTSFLPKFTTYALYGQSLNPIDVTIPKGVLGTYQGLGSLPAQDSTVTTPQRTVGAFYASVAQPMSQLYKMHLGIKALELQREIAHEALKGKKIETRKQVTDIYSRIAQTHSQIAGAESMLAYLQELSALTRRNLAEKTVLESDVLAVDAQVAQLNHQLLVLRHGLSTQKELLNRLLGRDLAAQFTVEAQPLPAQEEIDLDAAREIALRHRFELREARLRDRLAGVSMERTKADYIPDISLQFAHLSFHNIDFIPKDISLVGVVLQWDFFDWGKKMHRVREDRAALRQAKLALAEAGQQVLQDVNVTFRRLVEARSLIDVRKAFQKAEREKLRVVTDQYRQKAALLSDLLKQQAEVVQADAAYEQALSGYWSSRAAFYAAIGEE